MLANWKEVEVPFRKADRVFLFSDFDGTLSPIVERPEMAYPSPEIKRILQELSQDNRYVIGIISGRALKDLRDRIGIRNIIYAGNHGLEIEGPGFSFIEPVAKETAALFGLINRLLHRAFTGIKGVLVENKGLSLSVHYRAVPEKEVSSVKHALDRVTGLAHSLGKIRITTGKKVFEIRPPVKWDKGKAVNWLLDKYSVKGNQENITSAFMGDDLTDEDGFKAINRRNGISIFIGDEETVSSAQYYLRAPDEVKEFLRLLVSLN